MKSLFTILLILLLISCSGDDSKQRESDSKALRARNLALAYIDSGMMTEASKKLAQLEQSLPNEAFVYANQGLVALRQNELEEASTLLAKANAALAE